MLSNRCGEVDGCMSRTKAAYRAPNPNVQPASSISAWWKGSCSDRDLSNGFIIKSTIQVKHRRRFWDQSNILIFLIWKKWDLIYSRFYFSYFNAFSNYTTVHDVHCTCFCSVGNFLVFLKSPINIFFIFLVKPWFF